MSEPDAESSPKSSGPQDEGSRSSSNDTRPPSSIASPSGIPSTDTVSSTDVVATPVAPTSGVPPSPSPAPVSPVAATTGPPPNPISAGSPGSDDSNSSDWATPDSSPSPNPTSSPGPVPGPSSNPTSGHEPGEAQRQRQQHEQSQSPSPQSDSSRAIDTNSHTNQLPPVSSLSPPAPHHGDPPGSGPSHPHQSHSHPPPPPTDAPSYVAPPVGFLFPPTPGGPPPGTGLYILTSAPHPYPNLPIPVYSPPQACPTPQPYLAPHPPPGPHPHPAHHHSPSAPLAHEFQSQAQAEAQAEAQYKQIYRRHHSQAHPTYPPQPVYYQAPSEPPPPRPNSSSGQFPQSDAPFGFYRSPGKDPKEPPKPKFYPPSSKPLIQVQVEKAGNSKSSKRTRYGSAQGESRGEGQQQQQEQQQQRQPQGQPINIIHHEPQPRPRQLQQLPPSAPLPPDLQAQAEAAAAAAYKEIYGPRYSQSAVLNRAQAHVQAQRNQMYGPPLPPQQHAHQGHPAQVLASGQNPAQQVCGPRYGPSAGYGGPGVPGEHRPFRCTFRDCPLGFARSHDLKRHMVVHFPEKPFACESCGKRFGRQDALKRHILQTIRGCSSNNSIEIGSSLSPAPIPNSIPEAAAARVADANVDTHNTRNGSTKSARSPSVLTDTERNRRQVHQRKRKRDHEGGEDGTDTDDDCEPPSTRASQSPSPIPNPGQSQGEESQTQSQREKNSASQRQRKKSPSHHKQRQKELQNRRVMGTPRASHSTAAGEATAAAEAEVDMDTGVDTVGKAAVPDNAGKDTAPGAIGAETVPRDEAVQAQGEKAVSGESPSSPPVTHAGTEPPDPAMVKVFKSFLSQIQNP